MELLRKFRKSLDMTPSAPKMGRIPLPDVGGEEEEISPGASSTSTSSCSSRSQSSFAGSDDDYSDYSPSPSPVSRIRAPTPRRPIASSSCCTTPRRCTPQPPPSTPILKPALKKPPIGRTSTPSNLKAPISRPSSTRPSPPLSERSSSSRKDVPKKPLKGILKQPTPTSSPPIPPAPDMASPSKVALHWQLLPYESLMSKKKIFFNVAKDLECIRVDSPLYGRHLSNSDFDKVASPGDRLTSMKIQYPPHPQWTIKVQNSNGITCRDVYKAIHDHFQKKLSISDQKVYVSKDKRPTYEEALNARCRADPGLDDWIRKQGMKRVDMLEEGTYFHGLTRPADDKKHWVLNLCESSALTRSR